MAFDPPANHRPVVFRAFPFSRTTSSGSPRRLKRGALLRIGPVLCLLITLIAAALPAAAQDGDCSVAPPTYLTVGDVAVVLSNQTIGLVTQGPAHSGGTVGSIGPGDEVEILDGPLCDRGYRMWKVRTGDGEVGWISDGDGDWPYFVVTIPANMPDIAEPPPPPDNSTYTDCSDAPPNILSRNMAVMVPPGQAPNNLRFTRGVENQITGQLEAGVRAVVLDGPDCYAGYRWWNVDVPSTGARGWTQDGAGTQRWLVPFEEAPAAPQNTSCPGTPEDYLYTNIIAWVAPGNANNVRSGPGTGYGVLFQMAAQTRFTILEGPVCADGYRWWRIRTPSGQEGWTADGSGFERWLATNYELPVTPTWTPIPQVVISPSWTPMPQITLSPTPTRTPSRTPSPTPTRTPTRTPTATRTPTPSRTPTRTPTATPTQPQTRILNVGYSELSGLYRFYIDAEVVGYEGQFLQVLTWFQYEDGTYIPSATGDPSYTSADGYMLHMAEIQPCCQQTVFLAEQNSAIVAEMPSPHFPQTEGGYQFVPMAEIRFNGQVLARYGAVEGAPHIPFKMSTISGVTYSALSTGYRFYIDARIDDLQGQALDALVWLAYPNGQNIRNGPGDQRYSSSEGYLLGTARLAPCCASTSYLLEQGTPIIIDVPYGQFPDLELRYTFKPVIEIRHNGQVIAVSGEAPLISLGDVALGYIRISNQPFSAPVCGVMVDDTNILTVPDVAPSAVSPDLPVFGDTAYTIDVRDCVDAPMAHFPLETINIGQVHNFLVGETWAMLTVEQVTARDEGHRLHFEADLRATSALTPGQLIMAAWPVTDDHAPLHNNGDPNYVDLEGNLWTYGTMPVEAGPGQYRWSFDLPLNQFPTGEYPIDLAFRFKMAGSAQVGAEFYDLNFALNRPLPQPIEDHPCTSSDTDCDDIPDGIEDWIARTFTPTYYIADGESVERVAFPFQVTSDVTCVWQGLHEEAVVAGGDDYLLTVVAAWEMDYVEYRWWNGAIMKAADRGIVGFLADSVQGLGSLIMTGNFGNPFDVDSLGDVFFSYISPIRPEDFTRISEWTQGRDDFIHYGDTERLRICIRAAERLEPNPMHGANWSPQIGTARPVYYQAMSVELRRHGHTYSFEPTQVRWEDRSHPVIYVSEGKHGQYTSPDECSDFVWTKGPQEAFFWSEDCSSNPDQIIRPELSPAMNVGERDDGRHRQVEPAAIGALFPGELVWGDPFCGGHRSEVDNPSALADYWIAMGTGETICGGGLGTKWWP